MQTAAANPNIRIIETAAHELGRMVNEVVFLGGCATGLLLTDPAASPVRVTRDVDVIVEVGSLVAYHRFNDRLRSRGFKEDISPDAPICRWKKEDLVLDVMPVNAKILGFGNRWFKAAFTAAVDYRLPSGIRICILTAPYFLATKLEAFQQRGEGDFLLSPDMADIVAVIDGRCEIIQELKNSKPNLKAYVSKRFNEMKRDKNFLYALPGHLSPDPASQARSHIIVDRMNEIAEFQGRHAK